MSLKNGLILLLLVCLPFVAFSQFDSQRTQYMYGPTAYNPGALAEKDLCNVYGDFRLQWAGFKGAPKDVTVAADLPFTIGDSRHGLGISFMDDKVGLFENMDFQVQYAFKFNLWRGNLGLGLSMGALNQTFDSQEADFTGGGELTGDDYHKSTDIMNPSGDQSEISFDATVGAYYSDEQLYLGVSFMHFNRPKFDFGDLESVEIPPLLYMTFGYYMKMSNEDYHLKPSILYSTDFNSSQLDLDLLVNYKKKLQCGLGYRLGDSFSFLVGADNLVLDGLFLGYSYDLPVSGMIKSGGSHEVCLKYSFKLDFSRKNKYKSERIL